MDGDADRHDVPVTGRPAAAAPGPPGSTGEPPGPGSGGRQKAVALGLVALVALAFVAGLLGVRYLYGRAQSSSDSAVGQEVPGTERRPSSPSTSVDPSRSSLRSLVVQQADVGSTFAVGLLPGGDGLTQPTLDLCNGTFPSESRRTARLQDVVVDEQGTVVLSTEAVTYRDPAGAEQAFSELDAVAAACPATPVASAAGEPSVTTTFNPRPDADWPQTPAVDRKAFDFTTVDEAGTSTRYVAVYLKRGRVLMGVYFPRPDSVPSVAGQTTVAGIVEVFAQRLSELKPSVVGS